MTSSTIRNLGDFLEERTQRLGIDKATVYSVTNTDGFVRSLEYFDKRVFSQETANYKRVELHDLAYNPSRINVGSIAVCEDPDGGAVSPMYCVVRCKNALLPHYLLFFLRSGPGLEQIRHRCEGSVRFQLKFRDLCSIPLGIPSVPEQRRLIQLLNEAHALRKLRADVRARSEALIPALFYEMFGEPSKNPLGWPVLAVGELLESCDYGTSVRANEVGVGVPVLRMGNVTVTGQLDLTDLKTVELSLDELAKQQLREGDVLFNRTNSRELVGKTGMWDGRFEAVAASYFIRLRFRRGTEHPQHFTAFMNLPVTKHSLAGMARGAIGQANINSKELKSIRLPVPPVSLQEEFVLRVAEIRELEGVQASADRRLNTLFDAMLHHVFRGDL